MEGMFQGRRQEMDEHRSRCPEWQVARTELSGTSPLHLLVTGLKTLLP